MASTNGTSPNHIEIPMHANGATTLVVEPKPNQDSNNTNYTQRAQWLRAAVLGANDGLVSVASLMMGVGAVKHDITAMLISGFAGLVAGACSMAIGEFVSVYTQYDIEKAQIKRERESNEEVVVVLPNPFQAAVASAMAFSVGGVVPMVAAFFIRNHKVRMVVVAVAVSLALLVFGTFGAVLGRTPVTRSCLRVLIGGWMAMAITFGFTKLIGSLAL
ncbi:Vacuolar iron transporter 2.1 [Stylosanthes scabra]|uniref:Vacuolar iron transporter n=1 Tax=Stylosanthes scabra TaxID=79078 RepID=A0ABU6XET0_9FABA|nr:Vacuolar iron transporter 2.1 [Stylosanthes scabra]